MKEIKSNGGEPNYAARFGWTAAAIVVVMAAMSVATEKFGL